MNVGTATERGQTIVASELTGLDFPESRIRKKVRYASKKKENEGGQGLHEKA